MNEHTSRILRIEIERERRAIEANDRTIRDLQEKITEQEQWKRESQTRRAALTATLTEAGVDPDYDA